MTNLAASAVLLALVLVAPGCDQFKATTDRALVSLSLKPACPEPVDGRAAGAESAELALACFRKATDEGSAALLLRVTCRNRSASSCKQTDATTKEAERAMVDLKKMTWSNTLGKWNDDKEGKVIVFAIDTSPGEKKVSTVTTCRIADGDRWAVCELGELPREAAEQKLKLRWQRARPRRDKVVCRQSIAGQQYRGIMQRGGNQESGFVIHYEASTNVIHLDAWGFWDATISSDFADSMTIACRSAKPAFTLLARCSRLNPQRPEGQDAFSRIMKEATACRMSRALLVVQNSITKLQLIRLVKENAAPGWLFFPAESAALAALAAHHPGDRK